MSIQSHSVLQGSDSWHAFRTQHFGASEASSMLGLSPYKTRTQLLNEKKTGLVPEINAATQNIFDNGHRVEALARTIAEKLIGEELSPMTFSNGKLSASCDGISFMGDVAWENKQFNAAHYEQVKNGELPEIHWPQCQQVMHCSGAEKLFFTVSDGTEERTAGVWVYADAKLQSQLIAAWAQFEKDLVDFVPTITIEPPKAQPVLALPALFIHAKGEITTSNMKEYGEALAVRLAEVRAIVLVNDQDFANAKDAAKLLRDNIKQANLAKDAMLSQTVTVGEAARMIDTWCEDMRLTALQLEKDVKEQDLIKKQAMIQSAQISFGNLITALEKDTAPIRLNIAMPNFADAIKGKSKYDSMQNEISTLVANSTVEANRVAMDVKYKQAWMLTVSDGYAFLFSDLQNIIFKQGDDFKLLVETRIENHKKITAERDAKVKADAEFAAQAKVEADKEAKIKAEAAALAKVESDRIAVMVEEAAKLPTMSNEEVKKQIEIIKSAPELRSVVVEQQDIIASFFKIHNINPDKYHEYRAVIVEFIKHQASFNVKQAA